MQTCVPDSHFIGNARMEFVSEKAGEITWHCLDCDETIIQYQDCGSGC